MDEQSSRSAILGSLEMLREEIGCDFSAVGLKEMPSLLLRWPMASGHTNERIEGIAEKPGRGLSATVMKIGRAMPLSMTELVCSRQLQEYPVFLAENLRAAYAVPLGWGAATSGVLLVGDRKKRIYRTEERRLVAAAADRIAARLAAMPSAKSV
ncbi:GAF domain-containing protein [Cohnella sp. GCM10020058]|uniref:GAF domain-containing protein n=1 Tax=Cohnella sp. GCM10020058 TaxID=3317330 RepID=UPI003640C99E